MSKDLVQRFETSVFKNESGTSTRQVPASGATITVLRQGLTVSDASVAIIAGDTQPVNVYDVGKLVNGDVLAQGTSATNTLLVNGAITSGTQLLIKNTSASTQFLTQGTRLVPTTSPPAIYSDATGVVSTGSNVATTDSQGYASFYVTQSWFDYKLSGTGLTTKLFTDVNGGYSRDGATWVNARNYPSIQAACNALPTDGNFPGATVVVPQGHWPHKTIPP